MTLEAIDLTPRTGSEIRTDIETLLNGSEAKNIRNILERRGVVFFRGLDPHHACGKKYACDRQCQ